MDFVQKRERQTEGTVNTIESKVNDAQSKVDDIRVSCDAVRDAFMTLSQDQNKAFEKSAEHKNLVNKRIEEVQKTLLVEGVVGGSGDPFANHQEFVKFVYGWIKDHETPPFGCEQVIQFQAEQTATNEQLRLQLDELAQNLQTKSSVLDQSIQSIEKLKREHQAAITQLDTKLAKDRQDLLTLTIEPIKKTSDDSNVLIH